MRDFGWALGALGLAVMYARHANNSRRAKGDADYIFVLSGQSNMAGRGSVVRMPDNTKVLKIDELEELNLAGADRIDRRIVRMASNGAWDFKTKPWSLK